MKTILLVCVLIIILPQIAFAHPGGLNGSGCHTCGTNCEEKYDIPTGDYHCHAGGDRSVYTPVPGTIEPTPESEVAEPIAEPATSVTETMPEPSLEHEPLVQPELEPLVQESPLDIQESEDGDDVVTPVEETFTNDAQGTVVANEDAEEVPTDEGSAVLGLAILAGMGYGGYRGVKAIAKKIKK